MDEPLTPSLLVPAHKITRVSGHHGRRPLKVRAGLEMSGPEAQKKSIDSIVHTTTKDSPKLLLGHSEKPQSKKRNIVPHHHEVLPQAPSQGGYHLSVRATDEGRAIVGYLSLHCLNKHHSLSRCKLHTYNNNK
jgi:hypothetical protein